MDSANVRAPDSLWAAATSAGLSTAPHLREAGVDVAIVEAIEPGWSGSGRDNGQVIPTQSRRESLIDTKPVGPGLASKSASQYRDRAVAFAAGPEGV